MGWTGTRKWRLANTNNGWMSTCFCPCSVSEIGWNIGGALILDFMCSSGLGGPEGGDMDRCLPDCGDVCGPAGRHCGGSQSSWRHSGGLEESGQRQPRCQTRVSDTFEEKVNNVFLNNVYYSTVAWTLTLWNATPSGPWEWAESSWCWPCMAWTRPRSRDTSVPEQRRKRSCESV